jgi:hypothetical protein
MKPWHVPVVWWGVYEREPRMCGEPNGVVFAPYKTEDDANIARLKYVGNDPNYYVEKMKICRT